MTNRWNSLDQRTVDATSINVFKSRLFGRFGRDDISGTTGWAFSWTSPLSPRPYWLVGYLPVRLHKVNHKVNQ